MSSTAKGPMRIGIVGTGEMGRPLVDRVLAGGHDVTAFARRSEVRDELAATGVHMVDAVEGIARDADVVIIYVYTDAQVREIVLDGGILESMPTGSTLVIHTTGDPGTAVVIAEHAASRGVAVIDAPGTGGPAQVAEGTLNLFVGAESADLERCRRLFECYASRIIHLGAVGSGQRMKLLNNLLFGAHVQFATEVGRLCTDMGLDESLVLSAMRGASGGSAAIDMAAAMGSTAMLLELAGRFIHKDVEVARQLADSIDLDLGTLGPITERILDQTHSTIDDRITP